MILVCYWIKSQITVRESMILLNIYNLKCMILIMTEQQNWKHRQEKTVTQTSPQGRKLWPQHHDWSVKNHHTNIKQNIKKPPSPRGADLGHKT